MLAADSVHRKKTKPSCRTCLFFDKFFNTTGIGQHHTTILSDCTEQRLTEANANVTNMFNGLFYPRDSTCISLIIISYDVKSSHLRIEEVERKPVYKYSNKNC